MTAQGLHTVSPRNSGSTRTKSPRDAVNQSLWTTFWQEFCLEGEPHERCHVPGDGRAVVDGRWIDFASRLPGDADVIDLACGAGIVGRTLLACRDDVHVTGVDWANVPNAPVANLTIEPWVRMEDLPFADSSFDAAVSLFGIEYGDLPRTAAELARVLTLGAPFKFLVHHAESEISSDGTARRAVLRELQSAKLRSAFLSGDLAGIGQQRRNLATMFPGQPMVGIVSDYLCRNTARNRAERQAVWQTLCHGLEPEIALLGQQERAAKSAAGLGAWLAPLLANMAAANVSVLRRQSGEPIAWDVSGVR